MKNLIFFVLFLFLVYSGLCYYRDKKQFDNTDLIDNITFLDKDETFEKVKNNDVFKNTLYQKHYRVRNVNNWNEYMNLVKNSFSNFNKAEKEKLIKCARRADRKLLLIKINGFDGLKASKIPWYFGMMVNYKYEEGLPHTIGNTIIISKQTVNNLNSYNLINTLIHEKVHIYQKMYPEDISLYLAENGFEKVRKIEEKDDVRVNPDVCTDNYIYFNRNENRYYSGIKNRDRINSSQNTMEEIFYEHPFENMAIIIERLSLSKKISKYDF